MTEFGARRINKRPCTEAEMAQNMAVIDALIEEIQVAVSGGVVDNFTVNVTADDSTPSTLHDAINGSVAAGTYTAGRDPLITSNTVGAASTNQTELFFIDANAIPSYSNTGTWCLSLVNDVLTWVDGTGLGSGGGDAFTVKATTNDSTASFLHDAITTAATRDSTADVIVATQTQGGSGTNQTETLFADMSAVSGYGSIVDGETWPLVMARSGSTYTIKFASTFTGGGGASYTAGDYIDIDGTDIDVDLTEEPAHDLGGCQLLIHLPGEAWKWITASGYDNTKNQLLGQMEGTWIFMEIADWLNLLAGRVGGNDQSIGHDANDATEWQDDVECP